MIRLELQQPTALWCLLLVLPLVALALLRSRSLLGRAGRHISLGVRLLWVVLAAVAMGSPVLMLQDKRTVKPKVVILTDVSDSVASDAANVERLRDAVRGVLQQTTEVIEFSFAGETTRIGQKPGETSQTDIERAIRTADSELVGTVNGRIILLTDGRATRGDALGPARSLALRGVKVHAIPVGLPGVQSWRIARLEPPVEARVGIPASVRVTVECAEPGSVVLRLLRPNGEVVSQRTITLQSQATAMLHFTPKEWGVETYTVEMLRSGSTATQAQRRLMPVSVQGPPRILLADPFVDESGALKKALAPLNVPVDLAHPDQWPQDLSEYAAIIISDFSGRELRAAERQALRDYVEKDGGGLVFIAGPNVVPTRWQKNEMTALLPVVFRERFADVMVSKKAPASVVFVIDRSGSMRGHLPSAGGNIISKLDLVKSSVQASVALMPDDTHVAVVAFDTRPHVVVQPTPVTKRDEINNQIDAITVGGGTTIMPALDEGFDLLKQMPGEKHIVVLTDGRCERQAHDTTYWAQAIDPSKKMQARWTSIAVGRDADQSLMQYLATQTRGQYHYCDTADKIPQVFIQHAKQLRRTQERSDPGFRARPGPAAARLKEIDVTQSPQLTGRVWAKPRPLTDVVLLAPSDEPLLAFWQFGLGRVTAFTSDAKGAWGKDWITWSGYSPFWQQVVQGVMRPPTNLHVRVRLIQSALGVRWMFRVTDAEGRAPTDLVCEGQIAPIGAGAPKPQRVPLSSSGPGEYLAKCDLTSEGEYLASFSLRPGRGRPVKYVSLVASRKNQEVAITGPDLAALEELTEAGSGLLSREIDPLIAACSGTQEETIIRHKALWPTLIALVLLLWPLDLAARKWL